MNWGSDELGHRSAELRGWTEELRDADPADVDDSVPGAVEFAAATADAVNAGDADDAIDADDAAAAADAIDAGDESTTIRTRTCGFCRGEIPEPEALDADGYPVGGFEWVGGASAGETEAYHRECVEAGDGRFLAWGANGVLADETE